VTLFFCLFLGGGAAFLAGADFFGAAFGLGAGVALGFGFGFSGEGWGVGADCSISCAWLTSNSGFYLQLQDTGNVKPHTTSPLMKSLLFPFHSPFLKKFGSTPNSSAAASRTRFTVTFSGSRLNNFRVALESAAVMAFAVGILPWLLGLKYVKDANTNVPPRTSTILSPSRWRNQVFRVINVCEAEALSVASRVL
jgi:hypothetical protein